MSVIRKLLKNNSCKSILSYCNGRGRNYSQSVNQQNVITSGLPDIEISKAPIVDFVFEYIDRWENQKLVECPITGKNYTYGEFRKKAKNLDRSLRKKLKLQKGDVVAILLPNIPDFPLACFGILQAGLVVTTINPIYSPTEIATQLVDSGAKAVITLNELSKLAVAAIGIAKKQLPILTVKMQPGQPTTEGTINFHEFTDNAVDLADENSITADDLAFLPYSSGTTGKPKGVELTHGNIVANLCQTEHKSTVLIQETTADHQDVAPIVLPMFHIYGFTICTVHSMRLGSLLLPLPKFTPESYISTLKKYKPHVLYLAPPIAIFLANHPQVTKDDLQSIRTIMSGAAPLGGLDEEKLIRKADKDILVMQGYGLTETSPLVLCTRRSFKQDPKSTGSIGIPAVNTQVKLVSSEDPNKPAEGPNPTGELLIKGPQVMRGYHNRPEENKEVFHDGWLRTGDLMQYENGYFFVKDRMKELIKVKGFQVAPAELEEFIRDFPNVADAAVIGVPHDLQGEVPRAYIVPKPGSKIDCEKLNAHLAEKLAPYKQLKGGISIVENIPKNPSGKIMRRVLKEQFLQTNK